MIALKNQFFEKNIIDIIENKNLNYALLFHYNSISSKEWLELKKKVFQINPKIINKVIPNRFLLKLWKIFKIKPMTTKLPSNANFIGQALDKVSGNFVAQTSNFVGSNEEKQRENRAVIGNSCLFFCSNIEDLEKILDIIQVYDLDTQLSSSQSTQLAQTTFKAIQTPGSSLKIQNLTKSFSSEGFKGLHISEKFMNIGLLFFSKNHLATKLSDNQATLGDGNFIAQFGNEVAQGVYFNFFDTKKLIELSKKLKLYSPNQYLVFELSKKNQELINQFNENFQIINLFNRLNYSLYSMIYSFQIKK